MQAGRGPRSAGASALALLVAALLAAAAAGANEGPSPPATGRYDAMLCVTSGAQAQSCGPAQVEVGPGGNVAVQVSDIVYRLRLRTGQAEVIVTQGTMQIDEFDAGARWEGMWLRFADVDKRVRYEVQVGALRR